MKKLILLIYGVCFSLLALSPQELDSSFMLVHQGYESEARKILLESFYQETIDSEFICGQFLDWASNRPHVMNDHFNECAHYVVRRDPKRATQAITRFFSGEHAEVSEFAESFANWGLGLMESEEVLNAE